ncbi:hypothetical protein BDZ89DRAFT_64584 [Hymenopellis radicata]|nr:hypothetical protein BDZ89DRAFT_64584 [Hymenopellis radicata]
MVAHISPRHVHHRRGSDAFAAPTVEGVDDSGVTLTDTGATATGLAIATVTGAADSATLADPFVVSTSVIPGSSSTRTAAASASPAAAASSESISMGTVIGVCVGAFAGAAVLVLIGILLYKRSSPKPRDPVSAHSRNAHGEHARSRSRLENWDKLGEGKDEDQWDGKYQMKEADALTIAPMEKLTMFKKSTPSVRTMYTHKSDELPVFDLEPHPFSQYHAGLAQELASTDVPPVVKPFTNRQESAALSWEASSPANESFLSLRSAHMSGSMSPSLDMAIPTPPATYSELHRWESAEVLDFTGQKAEIVHQDGNPFEPVERRKSANNPFFGGRETYNTTHIHPPPPIITRSEKGKEREIVHNPFADKPYSSHAVSMSTDSNNERAIQSLIAALGVGEGEVEERLRVASMQTVTTTNSAYSDMTGSFPIPPR